MGRPTPEASVREMSRPGIRHENLRRLLYWVPVVYLMVAHFPGWYAPARPGLDGSWIIGLNLLADSAYRFGRDVVYTYGPLGYLLCPLPYGRNLIEAVVFWTLLHLLFGGAVFALRRRLSTVPFLVFAALYTMAFALGLPYEYHLLLLESLILLIAGREPRGHWAGAAAGVLAALFLFVKLSLGMTASLLFVAAAGAWLWTDGRRRLKPILFGAVAWLAVYLFLAAWLFRSLDAFSRWLTASRDLAGEYTAAMSIVGPSEFLLAGIGALIVMERLLERQGRARLDLTLMSVVALLIAFKHGFGRQDRHVLAFFPYALGLISLFWAGTEDAPRAAGRPRRGLLVGYLVILLLALPGLTHYDAETLRAAPGILAGRAGSGRFVALFRLPELQRDLRAAGDQAMSTQTLSPEMLSGGVGEVGIIPWEISLAPANHLRWRPCPVFQTHMAYTAYLDRLNAEHFAGAGPEHLLVQFAAIDGRNPVQETPAIWRALKENYRPAAGPDPEARLLLRRREAPEWQPLVEAGRRGASTGTWINVPPGQEIAYAKLAMRMNVAGRAVRLLFRIPPLEIDLETEAGELYSYRFLPRTAENGLWIGSVVADAQDLRDFLLGRDRPGGPSDAVRRFRILGDGAFYYRRAIDVTWLMDSQARTTL